MVKFKPHCPSRAHAGGGSATSGVRRPPPPLPWSRTPIPADATAAAGVQGGKHDDGGVVSGPAAHQRLEALRVQTDDMAPVAEIGHLLPSLAQGELRITARRGYWSYTADITSPGHKSWTFNM